MMTHPLYGQCSHQGDGECVSGSLGNDVVTVSDAGDEVTWSGAGARNLYGAAAGKQYDMFSEVGE